MKCKVLSETLGYNARVYKKGDDMEIRDAREVDRLTGLKVIEAGPVEKHSNVEVATVVNPPKSLSYKTKGGRKKKCAHN